MGKTATLVPGLIFAMILMNTRKCSNSYQIGQPTSAKKVTEMFNISKKTIANIQLYVSYFLLGLGSAILAVLVSNKFPISQRPMIRIIVFVLGLLSIEIRIKPEIAESATTSEKEGIS